MSDWSAAQYLKFKGKRTQPALDLLHRVALEDPETVLDLGCGPGNSTAVLRARYPKAKILGIDSSPDMIAAANKAFLKDAAGTETAFQICSVPGDLPALGQFDLVFSNACIQWIPNHQDLLPALLRAVKPGGVLAVQLPLQQEQPLHRVFAEAAQSPCWSGKIPAPRARNVLEKEAYFDLLTALSPEAELWEITYLQQMENTEAIVEWYRGTGLRPYLSALSAAEGEAFIDAVRPQIQALYPVRQNGQVLFPFPRLFFTVKKPI